MKLHNTPNILIASNIDNFSRYEGDSFGISGGVSYSYPNPETQTSATTTTKTPPAGQEEGQWGVSKSIGYGEDSDSQTSTTYSGINTSNITITGNGNTEQPNSHPELVSGSKEITAANLADIFTTTTTDTITENSGSLANTFDAEAVQKELDVQVRVTQTFDTNRQEVKAEINSIIDEANDTLDEVKEKLKNQNLTDEQKAELIAIALQTQNDIEDMQKLGVLVDAIANGLSAPKDSVGGIATSTLAPIVSYEIGQYFKENADKNAMDGGNRSEQGDLAHILSHALLGAVVSASNGGDALLGGIISGGTEVAAPALANFLYGKEAKDLTAEEKSTVSAILGLAGATIGSFDSEISAVVGSSVAQNAADNNWGEVGHYSTFATVLYLAGFSEKDAKAIALAALAPDTDNRSAMSYESVTNGLNENGNQQTIHRLNGEDNPNQVKADQVSYGKMVQSILNRITEINNDSTLTEQQKADAKATILTNPGVQNILHAYGDTYGHVQQDGTNYPPVTGHLEDGTSPDNPNEHKGAYINYFTDLYNRASNVSDELIDKDNARNISIAVTKSITEEGQKGMLELQLELNGAIGTSSMVNAPVDGCVGECGNTGSKVNPRILQIYKLR